MITPRALRVNERRGKKPQRAKGVPQSLLPSSYLELVTTCSAERETDRDERLCISSSCSPNIWNSYINHFKTIFNKSAEIKEKQLFNV